MTSAVYILGGPGVGKSTAMASLLRDWTPGRYTRLTSRELFGHHLLDPELRMGLYLGHLRWGGYPGTDALSMSVAPQAMLWLETLDPQLSWVFGEGTRLSHPKFLTALGSKTNLTVVHLVLDPEEALKRRLSRGGKLLSDQFCKAAFSKANGAAEACRAAGLRVVEVDASCTPEGVAQAMDLGYS